MPDFRLWDLGKKLCEMSRGRWRYDFTFRRNLQQWGTSLQVLKGSEQTELRGGSGSTGCSSFIFSEKDVGMGGVSDRTGWFRPLQCLR